MATRVLFRCDASPAIGAGHATRSRALALALRERGADVAFVMRRGWAMDGIDVLEAPPGADDELTEADLVRTIDAARGGGFETVVVDHYAADAGYFAGLRNAGLRVGAIDDRADRDLRAADWILNQNLAAGDLDYVARPDAVLLLGVAYALLRPEFTEARSSVVRRFGDRDARVLVTFGGGETADLCARLLEALEGVDRRLDVRCVTADAGERLARAAESSRHAVETLRHVDEMPVQMQWADVSVNAGGSTCWELLCLGLPMVVTALSSDQRRNPGALADAGLAVAVRTLDDAAASVDALLASPERRDAMSAAGVALVDGRGAERAAASLLEIERRVHAVD